MSEQKSGGFHFGDIGRDVKIEAGGDVVGGNKVTTTHVGFNDHTQKDEFLKQMDELRSALREIKSQVEGLDQFDDDAKDQLVMEILQEVSELKQAKQDAEQLEPGQSPPEDKLQSISQCLDRAGRLLDKIKVVGDLVAGVAVRIAPVLTSARHLLGIQ